MLQKIFFYGWESMFPDLKLMFQALKHRLISYKETFLAKSTKKIMQFIASVVDDVNAMEWLKTNRDFCFRGFCEDGKMIMHFFLKKFFCLVIMKKLLYFCGYKQYHLNDIILSISNP